MSGWVVPADARVWVAAAAVVAAACADATRDGAAHDAAARDSVTRDAFVDTPPCEPTLSSIQTNIFAVTCGFEYCHGTSPAAGLWLLDPRVERQLIGVRAGVCLTWVVVQPGSPERSLLWQKISSDHPPCRTERMPYGMGRLRPEAQACIHDWIQSLVVAPDAATRD